MHFKRTLVTAAATASLLLYGLVPTAFAADTISITGNGEASSNTATVSSPTTTSVSQSNSAAIVNTVTSNANTGGNTAASNTGGNVTVSTGGASSTNNITNSANANVADPNPCGCNNGGTSVTVSGNGEASSNFVTATTSDTTHVDQTNHAAISNTATSHENTGSNTVTGTTGGGVTVTTGPASATNTINNSANINQVGSGSGAGAGAGTGMLSATISGNGEASTNSITLADPTSTHLHQTNSAAITNRVYDNLNTGGNVASSNTGGMVTISTGPTTDMTTINNMANFNSAEIDCGCVLGGGVTASIADNGEMSRNFITATLGDDLMVHQDNGGPGLFNTVTPATNTGSNVVAGSTAGMSGMGGSSITTLGSTSTTNISNTANANMFGSGTGISLPGGGTLSLSFDLFGLLSSMGLHL